MKARVPKILIGLEIDIRKDGELALEEELLQKLDYGIVSIHSSFDLSKDENTKRIIQALSHPKAIILGHPTGRILNCRNSHEANHLDFMKFGVWTARRGWATEKDIIDTYSYEDLQTVIN